MNQLTLDMFKGAHLSMTSGLHPQKCYGEWPV